MREQEEAGQRGFGTRFLLYAQAPHVPGYNRPEIVWISTPPEELGPGPQDDRMYVADAANDKQPYEFPYLPPYMGSTFPPVEAGPDGHFDHLGPNTRGFISAHAYAGVRRVLDIWESYLGERVLWHFAQDFERLEIVPNVSWRNAQSGYGFLELGQSPDIDGPASPLALNLDVIAHEVGHAILFSLLGVPDNALGIGDFGAYHESCADLVSLLSFLHFDTGIDRLLRNARGNLLGFNELNRFAELSSERQIRIASNFRRMSEVCDDIHDCSRPFTGAVFDTLIELFHAELVERNLVDKRLLEVELRDLAPGVIDRVTAETAEAYAAHPFLFKSALIAARDTVGTALALSWRRIDPTGLTFDHAAGAMLAAMRDATGTPAADLLRENFNWREITTTLTASP